MTLASNPSPLKSRAVDNVLRGIDGTGVGVGAGVAVGEGEGGGVGGSGGGGAFSLQATSTVAASTTDNIPRINGRWTMFIRADIGYFSRMRDERRIHVRRNIEHLIVCRRNEK